MSSLMVSHDLHIMMLEVVVESVFVPWKSIFDKVILKKTSVMFRMLDEDWTILFPHQSNGSSSQGTCQELQHFHAGNSTVFSLPLSTLKEQVLGVDIQFYVGQEICEHFEMDSFQSVGLALVRVDDLFNGIIKELRERMELADYLSNQRQPISRSMKCKYPLMDEDLQSTDNMLELYIRISYLGSCVITEIALPEEFSGKNFLAREETNELYPYHFTESPSERAKGSDLSASVNVKNPAPLDKKKKNKKKNNGRSKAT